jgi:type IV secretion system protein VirB9
MNGRARVRGFALRLVLILSIAASNLLPATALSEPIPDPRLKVVDYRPTAVLPLTAFVGYHVHLEFAPGEYFVNLGAGDTSSLDVGAEGNHLLLKPKQPTGGTNLTILTNRRAYFVDYRALARAPRADEAVYSIVFRYSAAEASPDAVPGPRAPSDGLLDAPRPELNRDYWYCGSPSLRPLTALDDGLQLRLTFAPHAELPAVFAAEPDGEEALVNTHVESDTIVVHRLADRLVLRRGREVGCVVNRSASLPGRRAASGTIDAGVDRETREVER